MTLISNLAKSINPTSFDHSITPIELHNQLRSCGCNGCDLGEQKDLKGPVLFRGNPKASIMIIGECPGKREDMAGQPFIGPAGTKLDQILSTIGLNSTTDTYITNVVCCRPIAPWGSSKENRTPLISNINACRPFVHYQINFVHPKFIIVAGGPAVKALLPEVAKDKPVGDLVGNLYSSNEFLDIKFFVIYHPAVLLHSQNDPIKLLFYRKTMWNNIQKFKQLIKES
jgi:DNA polymerase